MKTSFNRGIAPLIIILIIAGVLVLAGGGWWWYKNSISLSISNSLNSFRSCLQVLTSARNSKTNECRVFPDSCIPEGWSYDDNCNEVNQQSISTTNDKKTTSTTIPITASNQRSTSTAQSVKEIVDWKTYIDEDIGIKFLYPNQWRVGEYGTIDSPESISCTICSGPISYMARPTNYVSDGEPGSGFGEYIQYDGDSSDPCKGFDMISCRNISIDGE